MIRRRARAGTPTPRPLDLTIRLVPRQRPATTATGAGTCVPSVTGIQWCLYADPLYTLVSNEDDWDRYQSLRWRAAERHARAHPDDPDLPEILERTRAGRDRYVRWERDTIGWAIYLFLVADR